MAPRLYNFAQPIRTPHAANQLRCRVTCLGATQAAVATLWLAALTISFVVAISGISGVEECLRKQISPPPPHPPPPSPKPPPPASVGVCPFMCKLQMGDRRCNLQCNTAACRFDGGDCYGHPTASATTSHPSATTMSSRPPVITRPTHAPTLEDLLGIRGRRLAGEGTRRHDEASRRLSSYDDASYDSYDDDSYDSYDSYDEAPPPRMKPSQTPRTAASRTGHAADRVGHAPKRDDDDDEDDGEYDFDGEWETDGERPSFFQRATDEVISPLLILVGTVGGLAALAALAAGLLGVCGAASSSIPLLRAAAVLSGLGALGGLVLAVGAAVMGGLLASGGDMLSNVIESEFPVRAQVHTRPGRPPTRSPALTRSHPRPSTCTHPLYRLRPSPCS